MNGSAHTTSLSRTVGLSAVVATLMCIAIGAWLHGAGTASAPEPAQLTGTLSGGTGVVAAAFYLSGTPTHVILWPATATAAANPPAAGTPCSNGALMVGQQTAKVIVVVSGNYRRCL